MGFTSGSVHRKRITIIEFVYSDENDPPGQVVYSDENDPPEQVGREIHGRAQPASPPSLEILRSLKALKAENSHGSHGSSLTSA